MRDCVCQSPRWLPSVRLVATASIGLLAGALLGCSNAGSIALAQPSKERGAGQREPSSAGDQSAVRVKTVRPTKENLKRNTTPQPAHVEPYEKTEIYAKVAGYLQKFGAAKDEAGKSRPLDIGDRVVKDQLLAELWVPELEQERVQKAALVDQAVAELGQAQASLAAAEAMVDAAKAKMDETNAQIARYEAERKYRRSEFDRYLQLVKEQAVRRELADEKENQYQAAEAGCHAAQAAWATTAANLKVEQAKLTKAKADVVGAEARLKVAKANLDQAVILQGYGTLKAPYDGIITHRFFDTGAFIQSAASGKPMPLMALARVDRLRILGDVPDLEAGGVKVGQRATLLVDAARGQPLVGRVARIAESLDPATRTMRTEVELEAPPKILRPGMFGSLTVTVADVPDAILVPVTALATDRGKAVVFVVEDGRARLKHVEVGLNDGTRVLITAGLNGNEQVITDGKNQLRDGQAVEIAK